MQHQNAVADTDQFRQVRRQHQHRRALLHQATDKAIDLHLRPDIHADTGLIQQVHGRTPTQPFAQSDFLLIATTELTDRSLRPGSLDRQLVDQPQALRLFTASAQQSPAAETAQSGQGQVFQHRKHWRDALPTPFLGHQRDPRRDGLAR